MRNVVLGSALALGLLLILAAIVAMAFAVGEPLGLSYPNRALVAGAIIAFIVIKSGIEVRSRKAWQRSLQQIRERLHEEAKRPCGS